MNFLSFSSFLPRKKTTTTNPQNEPLSGIEFADADRVAMALRSAVGGSTQNLFALYRDIILTDSHIQAEIGKRKLAVLGDTFRVLPFDKSVQADREAAVFCEKAIFATKGWLQFCAALLDGCLYPVSVGEKVFALADGGGFKIAELVHVPHYLLDYSTGNMRIKAVDPDGKPLPDYYEPEPDRYIIHRGHLLTTPDQFGGPMRSLIYWWLAGAMNREWWIRFLEKFGEPFIIGKYSRNDDREVILSALKLAKRIHGMAVTKSTEIEIKEASQAGALTFEKFHEIAKREKSLLILGQTLSANADPTGLGGGTAGLQGEVRDDIRKLDARLLAETIRDQLLVQLCRINNLPGRAPYITWGSQNPAEQKAMADLLQSLSNAGLEPDDDALEPIGENFGFGVRRKINPFPAIPQ